MDRRFSHWRWASIVLAIAAAAVGAEKAADRSAGEKTSPSVNLDGVWRGFVVEGKGELADRGSVKLELTIKGNRISAERLDGEQGFLGQGTYRIRTGKPMMMDGTETRNRGKGRSYLGICEIEADTIQWCVATPGNKRPKDFETKGQQFLLILKRQEQ
ncbi:MAG: hypothetical protein HUU20_10065 [Pirellulales bacterium]|nr:hypothetical protein [Pirellulales bacterium]